jgi:hypothetical protein
MKQVLVSLPLAAVCCFALASDIPANGWPDGAIVNNDSWWIEE